MKLRIRCKSETRSWWGRNAGWTKDSNLSPTTKSAKKVLSVFPPMDCNVRDALTLRPSETGKTDWTPATRKGPTFPSGPLYIAAQQ